MAQKQITSDQILSIEGTQIQNNELYGEISILNEPGSPIPAEPKINFIDDGGEIWFKDSTDVEGGKRITTNDGGGNWNFRASNYFGNGAHRFLTTGDGAAHIQIDTQNTEGEIILRVNTDVGSIADADISTWDNTLIINPSYTQSTQPFYAPFGTDSVPSYTFGGDTDTGIYRSGTNAIGFSTTGTNRFTIASTITANAAITLDTGSASAPALQTNSTYTKSGFWSDGDEEIHIGVEFLTTANEIGRFTVSGLYMDNIFPTIDDTYDIGGSGERWDDIYATNTTIQTSDLNLKTDVNDTTIGLNFVNALRPVEYKWKECKDVVYNSSPPSKEIQLRAGVRKHQGLIAQEVKTVMDNQGIAAEDFAGYITMSEGSPTTYGLRYSEFIAPLIKAVQELSARVEQLEALHGSPMV